MNGDRSWIAGPFFSCSNAQELSVGSRDVIAYCFGTNSLFAALQQFRQLSEVLLPCQ